LRVWEKSREQKGHMVKGRAKKTKGGDCDAKNASLVSGQKGVLVSGSVRGELTKKALEKNSRLSFGD